MSRTKLSDYPPCEAGSLEFAQRDWIAAPCGITKQSNALTRSNFDALMDSLDTVDPNGKTWEIVRWPHFEVGWIEVIFCQPMSEAATIADDTRIRLANYPCLDEDMWVEYEVEDDLERKKHAQDKEKNAL